MSFLQTEIIRFSEKNLYSEGYIGTFFSEL